MAKIEREFFIRFYDYDQDVIEKLEKLKRLLGEKTYSKAIKKIIREFEI